MTRRNAGLAAAGIVAAAVIAIAGTRATRRQTPSPSLEPQGERHMWRILEGTARAEQVVG